MSCRRAAAVLLCLSLVWVIPQLSNQAMGGKVVLKAFPNGNATCEVELSAAGSNSSAVLKLPKDAVIIKAAMDVTGRPYLENATLNALSKEDFAAGSLYNLDINTSPGDLQLVRVEGVDDEFPGTSLDPKWSWMNYPYSWDVGTSRPGYLHMVSNTYTNFSGGSDDASLLYQNASGSFRLETKIVSNPDDNLEMAGLMIRQDAGNWAVLRYMNWYGNVTRFDDKSGGNMRPSLHDHLSGSPMWLRIEKDDRQLTCYYSTNGNTWTRPVWGINPLTLTDPVKVGLIVGDGNAGTHYPAEFDYFRFLQYAFRGSLVSDVMQTAHPVSQVYASWTGPTDLTDVAKANTTFSVRADPAAPWQRLNVNNYTWPINVPGTQVQYKVELASKGLFTTTLYDLRLNLSSINYPVNASLGLGQAAPFWSQMGELSTMQVMEFPDALSSYLASAVADMDGNVTVPLKFSSDTPGVFLLRNLTIEYFIGVPPNAPDLNMPAAQGFVATTYPRFNLSGADADNDPLLFSLEISDDGFRTVTNYNQTAIGAGWSRGNRSYLPGEQAELNVIYPLVHGRSYSWRARAFDGAYWSEYSEERGFTVDTTPPSGGLHDEGDHTSNATALKASLDFTDAESGIPLYEYMVGTSPDKWDVAANATSASPSVSAGGLSLVTGNRYYFTARARNGAGLWSEWNNTDGIVYWPADLEADGVRIERPVADENISGTVTLSGTAWHRDGWNSTITVQARVDESGWRLATFKGGNVFKDWSMDFDTRQVLDGPHIFQARLVMGYMDGTQLAIAELPVNISNLPPPPPPPPFTAEFKPAGNATLSMAESSVIELTAAASTQCATIAWFVDGQERAGENFAKFGFRPNFTMAGTHVIRVTVSDGKETLEHSWTVAVTNVDRPPSAGIFFPAPESEWLVDEAITFNGSTSQDPDPEDTLRYTWTFDDGFSASGLEAVHRYSRPGKYTITLTVSDLSLEASTSMNITVKSPEKTIFGGGGGADLLLPLAVVAVVAAAGAAAGGGYWYLHRKKKGSQAAGARRPETPVMVRLPAITDEEEEASISPRETTREQWRKLESESGLTAGRTASSEEPSYGTSPAGRPYRPAGQEVRPVPPEEGAAETAEEIPMLETEPVEQRPPAPPAQSALRAGPKLPGPKAAAPSGGAPARSSPGPAMPVGRAPPQRPQGPKKADTLEDILALLEQNR